MKKSRKILKALFLVIAFIMVYGEIQASKPITIPALKVWNDLKGVFLYKPSSRIVMDEKFKDELSADCQTFKEDLKALKGDDIEIITSNQAKEGDIFLSLSSADTTLGKEGYSLSITDYISINARNTGGAFYGTRTVLQLLKHTDSVNAGNARDWPDYPERGFMSDNGRKYFSMSWIENHLKDMSYLKLNYYHFRISADEGFRLPCKSHPQITSPEFYSYEDIKLLQDISKKYHITFVPEFDMPGHVWAILKYYVPEMMLMDTNGCYYNGYFDITKDTTLSLVKELLDEFIPLFSGPYWHLGADEYLNKDFVRYPQLLKYASEHYGTKAVPSDTYVGFINWVDSIVKSHGKISRIWNDGISKGTSSENVVKLNKDIIIEYWEGDDQPQDFADAGYKIVNCSHDFLYYNIGSGWRGYNPWLYESWVTNIFQAKKTVTTKHKNFLGSKFHVWCANPDYETEGHIAVGTRMALRVLAQRIWGSPILVPTYTEFEMIADSLGRAPGVNFPENPMPNNLTFRKHAFASSVEKGTNNLPDLAIDGDYNKRWGSAISDTEWIYVDLEEEYNITRVKLVWCDPYPLEYKIQTSSDANIWKTIYNGDTGGTRIDDISPLSGKGRYVRIFCSKRLSDTRGYSLWELEVYDSTKISGTDTGELKSVKREMLQCNPNTFDHKTTINYFLENPCIVKISIFDIMGNSIAELLNEEKSEGPHQIVFNAEALARGEYFCRLDAGKYTEVKKLIISK